MFSCTPEQWVTTNRLARQRETHPPIPPSTQFPSLPQQGFYSIQQSSAPMLVSSSNNDFIKQKINHAVTYFVMVLICGPTMKPCEYYWQGNCPSFSNQTKLFYSCTCCTHIPFQSSQTSCEYKNPYNLYYMSHPCCRECFLLGPLLHIGGLRTFSTCRDLTMRTPCSSWLYSLWNQTCKHITTGTTVQGTWLAPHFWFMLLPNVRHKMSCTWSNASYATCSMLGRLKIHWYLTEWPL